MSTESTPERIERILKEKLQATQVEVEDFGAAHASHYEGDSGHFRVKIVSPVFAGKTLIEQHRLVNECLSEDLQTERIHALSLSTHVLH